jgi:CubicO group peptidase (beta-lactamase class C family)
MKGTYLVALLFSMQLFYANNCMYAQNRAELSYQFENSLSTNAQLKDSIPKEYNIYGRMKLRKVPAVVVAVIKNGNIVLSKQYGYSNFGNKIKADSTTLFHVASISKTANALCIMKFAEEGKLSLDVDFREYVKDGSFKENKYSRGQKITIANLLSHTAGIVKDDGPSGDYTHDKLLPTITQIIKGEMPALGDGAYSIRKPNELYQYSNQAICITQKILTDNFNVEYNTLLTNSVFNPLQMTNSSFELKLDSEKQKKLAEGYVFDYKIVPSYVFPCQSQGGLVSTASDIAKMVIAIQQANNGHKNSFLKQKTIQKMLSPQLEEATYEGNLGVPYKNGLGVMLFEKGGRQYFTHTGSIDGYTSLYVGSFDGKDGAVVIINTSYAGIITEIINSIAKTFEWERYLEYNYKTMIDPNRNLWEAYVGDYKLSTKSGEFLTSITRLGEQLFIQNSSDGDVEPLYFSSDREAFVLSRSYTISFSSEGGKQFVTLNNNGNFSGKSIKTN